MIKIYLCQRVDENEQDCFPQSFSSGWRMDEAVYLTSFVWWIEGIRPTKCLIPKGCHPELWQDQWEPSHPWSAEKWPLRHRWWWVVDVFCLGIMHARAVLHVCAVRNHFRSCIDSDLLRKHNLISPEDYRDVVVPPVPPPSGSLECHRSLYLFMTTTK